jgi:hypothetical protein
MNDDELRNHFAMHALSGLLAHTAVPSAIEGGAANTVRARRERYAALAKTAFEIADEMVKAHAQPDDLDEAMRATEENEGGTSGPNE